jgi:hypothetical protein
VRLTRQVDQRRRILPVTGPPPSHLARFWAHHPDRVPVAVTGAGNLGMNPGVQVWRQGQITGVPGPCNGALLVRSDGTGELAEWPPTSVDLWSTSDPGFVISGPLLACEGQPVPIDVANFPDPRHLLLFAYVEAIPGTLVDLGLDLLLKDPGRYARAARGEPVEIPLSVHLPESNEVQCPMLEHQVAPDLVRRALLDKGYREAETPGERGTFRLAGGVLTIAFLPGIYPHHVLIVREDGTVGSVAVSGQSNRAGVTTTGLSEDLALQGAVHALLMDNGGDVGIYLPQEDRFLVRPSEPDRARVWPLAACLIFHESTR